LTGKEVAEKSRLQGKLMTKPTFTGRETVLRPEASSKLSTPECSKSQSSHPRTGSQATTIPFEFKVVALNGKLGGSSVTGLGWLHQPMIKNARIQVQERLGRYSFEACMG
jgi:hypothetical protein